MRLGPAIIGQADAAGRAGTALVVAALLVAAAPAEPPARPAQPDEIVVTAARAKCRYSLAGQDLSSRELDAHAKVWATGKPVRVVLPASAGKKCMIKVGMRLASKGVQLMEFVEPDEARGGE